jgi:hypothetical protein
MLSRDIDISLQGAQAASTITVSCGRVTLANAGAGTCLDLGA